MISPAGRYIAVAFAEKTPAQRQGSDIAEIGERSGGRGRWGGTALVAAEVAAEYTTLAENSLTCLRADVCLATQRESLWIVVPVFR